MVLTKKAKLEGFDDLARSLDKAEMALRYVASASTPDVDVKVRGGSTAFRLRWYGVHRADEGIAVVVTTTSTGPAWVQALRPDEVLAWRERIAVCAFSDDEWTAQARLIDRALIARAEVLSGSKAGVA